MLSNQEIERIAKDIVNSIGEVNSKQHSLGSCQVISTEIVRRLGEQYKFPIEIDLISPTIFRNGGYSYNSHFAVYLSKQDIVIDTQIWQYGRFENLNRRKVLFSRKEYSEKGFVF